MLDLYDFGPVADSLTALLRLIEKELEFEDCFLSSRRWEHHIPEFRAINPQGTVPVLVHDGRAITESTVINEYLDDVFPHNPLRPADTCEDGGFISGSDFLIDGGVAASFKFGPLQPD